MSSKCAEVVKLVDAVDSKSTGLCARAGSIPAFGTKKIRSYADHIALTAKDILWISRVVHRSAWVFHSHGQGFYKHTIVKSLGVCFTALAYNELSNNGGQMFRHNKLIFFALVALMTLPYALGAISQASLLFLTFEPGARGNAMGRAYSAVADDAYAGWWNPGATAFNRKTQLAGTHIPWLQGSGAGLDDMYYQYLGWNQYFDGVGNLGVNLTLLTAGTQMQMDEDGNPLGVFSSFDFAGGLGYSYEVIPGTLGVGGNFKLIYSYLGPGTGNTEDEGSAFAFAFDLGAKFKNLVIPGLDAAIVLQNAGPDVTFVDQSQADPVPMTFRAGLGYTAFDNEVNRLIVSAEASKFLANEDPLLQRFITGWKHFDETIYGLGAEYTYLKLIGLRGGYFIDSAGSIVGPSFGVGLQYTFDKRYKLSADVALITAGDLTPWNQIFSLGLNF